MIIEKEIEYNHVLNFDTINQEPLPLSKEDCIDEKTDRNVSIKMEDNEGTIILLLEVMLKCIDNADHQLCIRGCYIRRFEYVKELLTKRFSSILDKFVYAFATNVKYKLEPTEDGKYLSHYHYVWTDKIENSAEEQCIIAKILGLNVLYKDDGIAIYKSLLPNK